jgi:hypothetical protein
VEHARRKRFPRFHDIPDWYIEDRADDGVRMPAGVWRPIVGGLINEYAQAA